MGKKKYLWHHPEHHPVKRLLDEAFAILKPLFEAAAQHDVGLCVYRGEGGDFVWRASRQPREPRDLHAFARLVTSKNVQDDVQLGLIHTIYDPDQRHQPLFGIELTRCLSNDTWQLVIQRYVPRRRPSPDVARLFRRLGMQGTRKRLLRHTEGDAEAITLKLAKDFKEHVIIPRKAREKART